MRSDDIEVYRIGVIYECRAPSRLVNGSFPPLLVLAHAGSFCKEVWRPFLECLDEIAKRHGTGACIAAFDISGHGDSVGRHEGAPSFNEYVGDDVATAIEFCSRNNSPEFFQLETPVWSKFDRQVMACKSEVTEDHREKAWDRKRIYGIGKAFCTLVFLDAICLHYML